MKKKTVLIFTDYYLPGYKAGGPIRSLSNLTEHLGKDFNFKIVTRDRDSRDFESYKNIKVDAWNDIQGTEVYYISPKNQNYRSILNILRKTRYDVLYLNSFFSYKFSLYPLLAENFALKKSRKIIIAPRGEFSEGAFKLKRKKKEIFTRLYKVFNLNKSVIWHASTEYESNDIRRIFKKDKILTALNLPTPISENTSNFSVINKKPNCLKIIFLSRITEKKNLLYALNILKNIKGKIEFNIYGLISDENYWEKCLSQINQLPNNIKVTFHGPKKNEEVSSLVANHHLFFFPTYGENYGHVIVEALSAGCPIVISDQTPWKDLAEKEVGYEISLENKNKFVEVLNVFKNMDNEDFQRKALKAKEYGENIIKNSKSLEDNRRLFQD